MISFPKILVPTDFSKGSEFAYRYANDLAKKFGSKVDLLHVIPSFRYLTESIRQLGLPFDMDKQLYPHLQKDATEKLMIAKKRFLDEEVQGAVSTCIELKVTEAINEKAESENYDLIVIGSQGANENSLIHGTITEHVIRNSKTPVLSVPLSIPDHPIRKLILPTDGSKNSLSCLPLALTLLEKLGGELTVLHISELFGAEIDNENHDFTTQDYKSNLELIHYKLVDFLRESPELHASIVSEPYQLYDHIVITRKSKAMSFKLILKIIKGVSSHTEIVDYANDHGDLIVMSTHGRSALKHLFLGSTTEAVARHATKPVLTFKSI